MISLNILEMLTEFRHEKGKEFGIQAKELPGQLQKGKANIFTFYGTVI